MLVPEMSHVVGAVTEPIEFFPGPEIVLRDYGQDIYDEGQAAAFSDMLTALTTGDDSSPNLRAFYARNSITTTVIPPLTGFTVVAKCDGEYCDCGAISVVFDGGLLNGDEVTLLPGQYGPLTTSDDVAGEWPSDEEWAAFERSLIEHYRAGTEDEGPFVDGPDDPYNWQDDDPWS